MDYCNELTRQEARLPRPYIMVLLLMTVAALIVVTLTYHKPADIRFQLADPAYGARAAAT